MAAKLKCHSSDNNKKCYLVRQATWKVHLCSKTASLQVLHAILVNVFSCLYSCPSGGTIF